MTGVSLGGKEGYHTERLTASLQSSFCPQLDTMTSQSVARLAGCSMVAPAWILYNSFLTPNPVLWESLSKTSSKLNFL